MAREIKVTGVDFTLRAEHHQGSPANAVTAALVAKLVGTRFLVEVEANTWEEWTVTAVVAPADTEPRDNDTAGA